MIFTRACSIKINLTLRVFGRREDGYHAIHSLFWRRRSPEILEVERTDGQDELSVEGVKIEGENLLIKSCALLRSIFGEDALPHLSMKLFKRLPTGSGLGAGSGNAAELVRHFFQTSGEVDLPIEAQKIASLGADVAFLASAFDLALADGVGERLEGLDCSERGLGLKTIVFIPGWSSGTAEAYAALDRSRKAEAFPFMPMSISEARNESLGVLRRLSEGEIVGPLPNDFIACDSVHAGFYGDLYGVVEDAGALAWGLCGSGSSCFALFDEKKFPGTVSRALSRILAEESSRFTWLHKTLVLE